MRKNYPILPLLAATLAVSSCRDYDLGISVDEIKYKKNFTEAFGKVDPEQDWNFVTRASITVTTDAPSSVKVFALTDRKYKLVADYADVSGTKKLGFDVREDVTDLKVSNGCIAIDAKVGESVSFSGTRAGHYGTTGEVKVTEITDENSWFVFDLAESEKYQQKLPENVDNLGKVTQNFTFISNGEFTVYPIYWQTDNTDDIGIYFTDVTGYHEIPIYTNKSGDELQYQEMTGHDPANDSSHPGLSVGDECPYHSGKKILYLNHEGHKGSYYIYCEANASWENVGDLQKANSKFTPLTTMEEGWGTYVKYYRSKGVKMSIPAGTLFGMYVKPSNGVKQYSQQEKNSSIYSTAPSKDVVAATFTLPSTSNPEEEDMYLCFEDWQTSSCDKDLNDIVFRFYGSTPTVVDEDADKWVICAEDLGNTFDLDYNDVVVSVSHISGKEKAYITPLAAGGTLASYIYFGSTPLGEIHELFGASNANSGNYKPINVFGTIDHSAPEIEVNVTATWSLASSTVGDASFDSTDGKAMGGFTVKVVPEGQASNAMNAEGAQTIQSTYESGTQNIPYVICVPQHWERTDAKGWFRWSNETTPISPLSGYNTSGYNTEGHTFADWVSNKSNNDWYMYPDEINTTGQQGVTVISPTLPGGGDGGNESDPTDPISTGYGTEITADANSLALGDSFGYDIYATFSTSGLPTEGNVTFTVEIHKGSGYINAQDKGIHKSADGSSYAKIETYTFKAGNNDSIVQYTISASDYASCSHIKIITDAGSGASITKVSYKSVN